MRQYLPYLAIALSSGCYDPKLDNPGFYCHADDQPACPDGQTCINGRCAKPGTKVPIDGGAGDGGDDQQQDDMGGLPAPHDMAKSAQHDLSQPPPPAQDFGTVTGMTGCAGLVQCVNNCSATDQQCPTDCENNTTQNGLNLFNSLLSCIQSACPSNYSTDPCYNSSSTKCSNCLNSAQSSGGACESELNACSNDGP